MAQMTEALGWMGDGRRGAQMGRTSSGNGYGRLPARSVRLFRVRLNAGGYDDGGAYWGHRPAGLALWCARTSDRRYEAFTDAVDREAARIRLALDSSHLMRR